MMLRITGAASPTRMARVARMALRSGSTVCVQNIGRCMATTSNSRCKRETYKEMLLESHRHLRSFSSALAPTPSCDFSSDQEAIDEANAQPDAKVDIKDTDDGRGFGLYSRKDLKKGELVFRGAALSIDTTRTTHTVQIDWDKHVTMDMPATLVNHSCDANVGIQENELGAYDFFALCDIPVGAEILWDYETAEDEIGNFPCSCGADKCRGTLQGFNGHGDEVLKAYGSEYVASYLLQK